MAGRPTKYKTFYAKKYGVDRRTISDILNGKKLYLEKLCK